MYHENLGVAGICLTHEFLQAGCDVQVIDNDKNVSSAVAAGIINPLVFRRMTLSWRGSELIPFARDKYREMEELSTHSFFHPLVIRARVTSPPGTTLHWPKSTLSFQVSALAEV